MGEWGYKQIQDDMGEMNIERVGVEGLNPDLFSSQNPVTAKQFMPTVRSYL